jgi:hypothetical protein
MKIKAINYMEVNSLINENRNEAHYKKLNLKLSKCSQENKSLLKWKWLLKRLAVSKVVRLKIKAFSLNM